GAARVRARDLDPAVLSEVRHNLELNGIEPGRVELQEGNLLDGMKGPVNLLTANIIIEPLLDMLPSVPGVLAGGGRALFSGLLAKERDRFQAALAEQGLRIVDELVINDWWGVAAERNDEPSGR
ncbi:MAG: 50S ribosomal protein L11 methyltransferase, partial [Aminobacteriaceae bacterium]